VTRGLALLAVFGAAGVLSAAAWATVDPRAPQQRHTAADTRLAKTLGLRLSDLASGWKLEPPQPEGPPCTSEPDESTLIQTARVDASFLYKDGVTEVGSEVDIFKTAAMDKADWVVSSLKVTGACLLADAKHSLSKQGKVTLVQEVALKPSGLAARSLHYRFVLALRGARTVDIVTDVVALSQGRFTVVLHSLSLGSPIPASSLKALTTTLAGRLPQIGTSI
jgi:hypothetical protein